MAILKLSGDEHGADVTEEELSAAWSQALLENAQHTEALVASWYCPCCEEGEDHD